MSNCPNCGAEYRLEDVKCPYCESLYFDMSCIDFTNHKPMFLKLKVPYGDKDTYVTQCVMPSLGNITICNDTVDAVDSSGMVIKRFTRGRNVTTEVKFDAIPYGNNNAMVTVNVIK